MMTEAQAQKAVFEWAGTLAYKYPCLRLMFHVPNGGKRDYIEASHLKAQGVKAGVPDIFLPAARGGCHGLFIEMKREKGGVLTSFQSYYIEALMREGYRVAVCHGRDEAVRTIEEYLKGNDANDTTD